MAAQPALSRGTNSGDFQDRIDDVEPLDMEEASNFK